MIATKKTQWKEFSVNIMSRRQDYVNEYKNLEDP